MAGRILNIAHRGASADFPENTLCAFAAAIAAGADLCELDVQRTADGGLVVMHDEKLERTTNGSGEVARIESRKLFALDAGGWFSSRFTGERIPSLEEVFELTQGRGGLNVEIKAKGIEEAVVDVIRRWGARETTLVSSFDRRALARIREIAPEIRIGVLADRGRRRLVTVAEEMGAAAINPRHDLVDQRLCAEAHRKGLQVYAWTVDDPAMMRRLIELGVDGIMTNRPGRLRALLGS